MLYERAIAESGGSKAMVSLGNVLRENAEGLERSSARFKCYESAIEKVDMKTVSTEWSETRYGPWSFIRVPSRMLTTSGRAISKLCYLV